MHWRYRHSVLTLCTLAFFVTMVARLGISPLVPAITDEFVISNARIGAALTGMWVAYAVTQFPSGILADRFGERPVILVAVGGTAVASVAIAASPAFWVFVLATILLGAVAGLHYTAATTLLTKTYEDTGTAVGIHTAGSPLAGLVAPIAVAWVAVRTGWRPAIALAVAASVPVFVLFAWRVRATPPRHPKRPMREQVALGPMRELLGRPPIAFTVALTVISLFVWQGNASFLPTFLVEHRGYPSTLAAAVFSAYFVIQGLGLVIVGAASDRYGRDPAIAGCMVAAALGYAAFVAGSGVVSLVVGVLLVGLGLSFSAALFPRFLDEFSAEEQNAGFGLVRTVAGVLGASGSVSVGLLADTLGWAAAIWVLVGLLLVVFAALAVNGMFDLGY